MRVFRTKIRQFWVSELVQWVVSFLALESRLVFWRCERFLDLDSREEVVEAVERGLADAPRPTRVLLAGLDFMPPWTEEVVDLALEFREGPRHGPGDDSEPF